MKTAVPLHPDLEKLKNPSFFYDDVNLEYEIYAVAGKSIKIKTELDPSA